MRREDAIVRLRAAEPEIRAFGVGTLYLFGSVARDEARADSDIDVFVEPATERFYSLTNYMGVYLRLVEAFPGLAVGYSTRDGLSKHILPEVEREAIRIF
ncbi:nucleotidyltransferase family protein [Methylobacterium sp. A54F]